METDLRKKPGPIARTATVRTNVLLDADLLEWAKREPGGLSDLVRRLLREEKDRQDGSAKK